jgi:hypothetical protein
MQGRSYIDMARGMNNALGLTVRRWQRIFRTEGHRAQAESTVQGLDDAEEQGLEVRRRLQPVLDDRTRPQSAQMDGQIADAEGYFHYPPTAEDGDPKSRYPGNTGVAAYDVNDREVVVVDIPGVTDVFRRIRGEGVQPYQTFRTWATDRGLTENIYGQEYKL